LNICIAWKHQRDTHEIITGSADCLNRWIRLSWYYDYNWV